MAWVRSQGTWDSGFDGGDVLVPLRYPGGAWFVIGASWSGLASLGGFFLSRVSQFTTQNQTLLEDSLPGPAADTPDELVPTPPVPDPDLGKDQGDALPL
jgi:hypothetical protein